MPRQKLSASPCLKKIAFMIKFLAAAFLFPGTVLINALGVTPEQDGGIMRSMFNMIFWSVIVVYFALIFTLKT